MNDLTLQKARAYEAEHGAAISPAERPAYHMTPYVGWLNDPNGFSYYKGKYHQFYQYNPYDVRWAPMHWGHAVSTDLLHWEYLPCALAPDSPVDNGPGCFSGSATEMDDGKQLLMYTSVIAEKQPNGEMRDIQTQSIAIGDGLNYEKPACNPVLTQKDLPEGFSKFDFRDPKIWREADGTVGGIVLFSEDISKRKLAEHELKQRNEELERFNLAAIGRELRMIELKRQVNALTQVRGQPPPYDLAFTELSPRRVQ